MDVHKGPSERGYQQRMKQLAFVREWLPYTLWLHDPHRTLVPPLPDLECSKRCWYGLLRVWKRQLHETYAPRTDDAWMAAYREFPQETRKYLIYNLARDPTLPRSGSRPPQVLIDAVLSQQWQEILGTNDEEGFP